jgi:hypothetical protein
MDAMTKEKSGELNLKWLVVIQMPTTTIIYITLFGTVKP